TTINGAVGPAFTFATSTGIQITTSTGQVTFSNTGVTSLNGQTGSVNISTGLSTSSPVAANQYAMFSSGNAVTNGLLFQNAGATELELSATPTSSTSAPLVLLGPNILNSTNASGTYLGVNAASTYNGDFVNFEVNSTTKFELAANGNLLLGSTLNASGTISQNGVPVLTTSTGLTVANFATSSISQFVNDKGYITSSSIAIGGTTSSSFQLCFGLSISSTCTLSFTTTSISQFVNDKGYLTGSAATTTINGAVGP